MNCNVHVKNVDKTRFGYIYGTSDMKRFRTAFISIIFLLCIFFVGIVNARGGIFIVEPSGKATERVEFGVSDEVHGNLSVSNGFIDFYIASPSGTVLLCYNKTAFNVFNLTAEEEGNYTFHLVNSYQTENVNVTLNYFIVFTVDLYAEVNVGYSLGTAVVIGAAMQPRIDWLPEILKIVASIPGLAALVKTILKFLRWLRWKMKRGKSRTPVVIKRPQ